jgi:hypothetical protein
MRLPSLQKNIPCKREFAAGRQRFISKFRIFNQAVSEVKVISDTSIEPLLNPLLIDNMPYMSPQPNSVKFHNLKKNNGNHGTSHFSYPNPNQLINL